MASTCFSAETEEAIQSVLPMEGETSMPPLRVMQWNILADGLAQFGDFVRVPKEALQWSSRAPKLLTKILEAAADIVCLQELNHYDDYFLPEMQKHGYCGLFRPKRYSPAVKYGFPPDGCAVFFRTSRLQHLEQEVQTQDGLICPLKDLETNQELFLATIHLKAKAGKENEGIRLEQVQKLLQNLVICTRDGAIPCVICGDFNTTPHSVVYELMNEHRLGFRSVYACRREIAFDESETSSVIQLGKSADGRATAEPPFTTWKFRSTGEKQETIDYIWVSRTERLIPDKLWQLPSASSLGDDGLPSEAMPSDHVPLLCNFLWK